MLEHWPGGWEPPSPHPSDTQLQRLVDNQLEHHPTFHLAEVARHPLPFYDSYDLLRFTLARSASDDKRRYFALYSSKLEDLRFLNWGSAVIHNLNGKLGLDLTEDNVLDYLRFFCYFVAGDEGPFQIVESAGDLVLENGAEPDTINDVIEWSDDVESDQKNLPTHIRRPALADVGGCDGFGATATIVYSDALFYAEFCVQPSGYIEMTDDEHIAAKLPIRLPKMDVDRGFRYLDLGKRRRFTSEDRDELRELLTAGVPISDIEFDGDLILHEILRDGESRTGTLAVTQPLVVRRALIRGNLDLQLVEFESPVAFEDCEIRTENSGTIRFDEVHFAKSFKMEGCTVRGKLVGTDAHVGGRLSFEDTEVQGAVEFGIKGVAAHVAVNLTSVSVAGDLDLEGIRTRGTVDLSGSRFGGRVLVGGSTIEGTVAEKTALDLSSAVVDGSVTVGHRWTTGPGGKRKNRKVVLSTFYGGMSVAQARIEGDWDLQGLQSSGGLDAQEARISGNIDARPPLTYRSVEIFDVTAHDGRSSQVASDHEPDYAHRLDSREQLSKYRSSRTRSGGHFNLYQAEVEGFVDISGMAVDGSITGYFAKIGSFFSVVSGKIPLPSWIAGDLGLGGARISNVVRCSGLEVGGSMACMSLHSGDFSVRASDTGSDAPSAFNPVVGGAVGFRSAEINGRLDLRGLVMKGTTAPWAMGDPEWQPFAGMLFLDDCEIAADIDLDEARIAGCVLLRDTRLSGRFKARGLAIEAGHADPFVGPEGAEEVVRQNWGCLNIDNCRIGGDLELRCMTDRDRRASAATKGVVPTDVAGDIDLSRNSVNGHVDLRCLRAKRSIDLSRTVVEGDIRLGAKTLRDPRGDDSQTAGAAQAPPDVWSTECGSLKIERLACNGDVDLTGARIKGWIHARRCAVAGRLELLDQEVWKNTGEADLGYARSKALDLTAADVSHLIVFRRCFENGDHRGQPASKDATEAQLVFQRAQIDRFELHKPLPAELDLRNVSVKWWDVVRGEDVSNHMHEGFGDGSIENDEILWVFGQLLREDVHKEASTFTSIERALNDQGHREKAEQIRQWLWNSRRGDDTMWCRTPKSEFRPSPDRLHRWAYHGLEWFGYGKAGFLLLLAGISLLFMSFLFSVENNVAPSLATLQAVPELELDTRPSPADWSPLDATALAFRTHVPMLSIVAREDWRPSPYSLASPVGTGSTSVMSAEDVATIVSAIAWGWWALFLLSITGITRRAGLSSR